MYNHIKSFFLKPYFITVIISTIVIVLLPDVFDKYIVEVIPFPLKDVKEKSISYSYDLDNDGISERIDSYDYEGKHSLQVITHDGGIVDQWNLKRNLPITNNRVAFGNYDNDLFSEIYTFSERNDTLFLFCIEPMDDNNPLWIDNIPLLTLTRKYNKPDFLILNMEIEDMNNDGHQDLFFILNSGQARFPRNLYIYDIFNDTLLVSPNYGITINAGATIRDINNDGLPEIFGDIQSPGQIHDSLGYKYSDYDAWLMVYDSELNLLFEPKKYPGFLSCINVDHVRINSLTNPDLTEDGFVVFYNHRGKDQNIPLLQLLNSSGEIINETSLGIRDKTPRKLCAEKVDDQYKFHIIETSGKITTYNEKLVAIGSCDLKHGIVSKFHYFDLDNDGKNEKVIFGSDKNLIITRNDFSHPVYYPIGFAPIRVDIFNTKQHSNLLFVTGINNNVSLLAYNRNPLYYYKYLFYFGVLLLTYLFITLIRKLQLIQIRKNERIKNQIVNLQLKSFKNQMDPHFTFNVFNAIAHKIQKESPNSYEAFVEFSNFIRKTLLSSDSITRSISDELSKLESYLKLEKLRFGDKIEYTIQVDESVDTSFQIPKMILQTYVENAIKHGIRHKKDGGMVSINVISTTKYLSIEIIDDGVGRESAKKMSTDSTGFGLRIMDNYFSMFNEYNVLKIRHLITDLYDDQQFPAGTKVNITIPHNFRYIHNKSNS